VKPASLPGHVQLLVSEKDFRLTSNEQILVKIVESSKDVPRQTTDGPFPLFRAIFNSAKLPIESLAVHRIFVRGSNRFEIAAHQFEPEKATDQTESEMVARLNAFVDDLTNALQSCTLAYTRGAKP
jgi:hypothetical protein